MALSFDGINKVISITTVNELDVKDLWSRWVDWWLTADNSKYEIAMEQLGGNDVDLVAGTTIPIYIYLLNGWKVKPREASHTLAVTNGILLTSDSSDPFLNTTGSFMVRVNYQQPVQALTVSSGAVLTPSPQEIRNAMTLAPTDIPAVDSIDTKLGGIKTDTEGIKVNTGLIPALV